MPSKRRRCWSSNLECNTFCPTPARNAHYAPLRRRSSFSSACARASAAMRAARLRPAPGAPAPTPPPDPHNRQAGSPTGCRDRPGRPRSEPEPDWFQPEPALRIGRQDAIAAAALLVADQPHGQFAAAFAQIDDHVERHVDSRRVDIRSCQKHRSQRRICARYSAHPGCKFRNRGAVCLPRRNSV